MVFSSSITSKNRSAAVRVSNVIASRNPMDSTGQRSTVAVAKYAARPPIEIWSFTASSTPASRLSAKITSGTSSSHSHRPAIARAFSISVPRSSSAWLAKFASACLPRPNALSTRMPCTDSSTVVARSPAWSWLRRATTEYFFSKR
jgi:hypothetical protein